MKASLQKLLRLHALRSELAEAALMQTRQIDADLQKTVGRIRMLQASVSTESSAPALAGPESAWCSYVACSEVAVLLQTASEKQMVTLKEQREAALEAQQRAVIAREQMARLAERRRNQLAAEAERREQARLDEAHASALFRRAMPTRF